MEAIRNALSTVQSFSQTALPTLKQIAPPFIFGASTMTTAMALAGRVYCRRRKSQDQDGLKVEWLEPQHPKAAKVMSVIATLSAVAMAASGAVLLNRAGFNKTGLGDGSVVTPSTPLITPTTTLIKPPKVTPPHRGPWHRRY